jgi:cytochrome P450/NADPH-cytochrome P450 reductase
MQFGDGLRACIGRAFAEQEILINLAMVLQKFDIEKVKPEYKLGLTGQMGVKPVDFRIRVRRRSHRSQTDGIPGGVAAGDSAKTHQPKKHKQATSPKQPSETKAVSVFFGGNQGTSESLVQGLSAIAPEFGLSLDIQELDAATENLPTDKPCIIITPSYEGRPPDNAKKFVAWIESLASQGHTLPGKPKFAVFGVGNSDWVHTFHRIPILIDETLEKLGAERMIDAGFANVKRDLFGPWESWSENLCMLLSGTTLQNHSSRVGVDVHIEDSKLDTFPQLICGEELIPGVVTTNFELAGASEGPAKRHTNIRLPSSCGYRSGDYLAIHGQNSDEAVSRVMKRFCLTTGNMMSVQSSKEFLPKKPMTVEHFLRSRVELAAPISKKQLEILASFAPDASAEHTLLTTRHEDVHYQQLLDQRYSLIDVLEEVPQLALPFGVYIDLLLPLLPRVFSISSSPVETVRGSSGDSVIASITFDVFEAEAMSGHGTFHGVASSYLASRIPGDSILCSIRPTKVPFQLPSSLQTPIIMVAAGTGIAPMRAFCQERAAIHRAGRKKLGPALLFFGCRHPEKDYLYRSELENWEKEGIVEVVPCFSRPDDRSKGIYVSDALWQQRERVWEMLEGGACVYTCGRAGRLGRSAAAAWRRIWMEKTGKSETEALEWLDSLKQYQYISDVY